MDAPATDAINAKLLIPFPGPRRQQDSTRAGARKSLGLSRWGVRFFLACRFAATKAVPTSPITAGTCGTRKSRRVVRGQAMAAGGCAGMETVEVELPPRWFPVGKDRAVCRAILAPSNRRFGAFAEKTLQCNVAARNAFDHVCDMGGFTQSWAEHGPDDQIFTMTKIPVVILVKLMLGLPEASEDAIQSLTGAYSICMFPRERTCMNVIAGRRPNGSGGYVLDKFSLYYPDNATATAAWGDAWDLLQGYSFRTAVLNGSLNRADLSGLRAGSIPVADGAAFDGAQHGLVIDSNSEYEDCAYVSALAGEPAEERVRRIDGLVAAMVAAYGSGRSGQGGILAASFDPLEQEQGLTALQSEWNLLKKHL